MNNDNNKNVDKHFLKRANACQQINPILSFTEVHKKKPKSHTHYFRALVSTLHPTPIKQYENTTQIIIGILGKPQQTCSMSRAPLR